MSEPRKPIKVMWVGSWRDVLKKEPHSGANPSLHGYSILKERKIYGIRGVTSASDVEHEKYHIIKRHPDAPRDARDVVAQELDATKYAYDKIGQPKHLFGQLLATFNDITMNYYEVPPKKALITMKRELWRVNPPSTWKQDYYKLEKEYRKVYGRDSE